MRQFARTAGALSVLATAALVCGTASAQTEDMVGPHNPYCGAWVQGTWTPNGNCVEETATATDSDAAMQDRDRDAMGGDGMRVRQRVVGTITSVKGHLVTLQQATRTLNVDDSRALDRQMTGRVAVGRSIVAHGYWEGGTFFASRFDSTPAQ
jgi:hypothetical protein